MKFSAKNKIIFLCLAWLVIIFAMFTFFFKFLDASNEATLKSMAQDRRNLVVLRTEDESYKKAEADLKQMSEETHQPDDFFSRDITLIEELNTLQELSDKYNVQMELTGVSGTVNSAPAAPTVTPIVMVPYSISLSGDLREVVGFIENLENLSFVTKVSQMSITSGDKGNVNVGLSANFYLRK